MNYKTRNYDRPNLQALLRGAGPFDSETIPGKFEVHMDSSHANRKTLEDGRRSQLDRPAENLKQAIGLNYRYGTQLDDQRIARAIEQQRNRMSLIHNRKK